MQRQLSTTATSKDLLRLVYYILFHLFDRPSSRGEIVVKPMNQVSLINDSIVFNCESNSSTFVAWWFSKSGIISVDETSEILINKTTLVILSVQESDAGSYACFELEKWYTRYVAELIVLRNAPDSEIVGTLDSNMSFTSTTNFSATCNFSKNVSSLSNIRCARTSVIHTTASLRSTSATEVTSDVTLTCSFDVHKSTLARHSCERRVYHQCASNLPKYTDHCVESLLQQLDVHEGDVSEGSTGDDVLVSKRSSSKADVVVYIYLIVTFLTAIILFGAIAIVVYSRKHVSRQISAATSTYNVARSDRTGTAATVSTLQERNTLVPALSPTSEASSDYQEIHRSTQEHENERPPPIYSRLAATTRLEMTSFAIKNSLNNNALSQLPLAQTYANINSASQPLTP